MSYDLALDRNNDLVFSASRDLLTAQGTAVVEQRIKTRLKIRRGSWVFDEEKRIGSRLDSILGRESNQAASRVSALVFEALNDADDIQVTRVDVIPSSDSRASMLSVIVGYVVRASEESSELAPADEQMQEATIEFQV